MILSIISYALCHLYILFGEVSVLITCTFCNWIIFLKRFLKKFILFNLFLAVLVFVAVHGLSLVAASGGYSSLRCAGFSLWWLLLLWSMGSRRAGFSSCGLRAVERRLSSCGAWAQSLCGMWDLPRPGLESVSPALAGRFLTTAPPGKTRVIFIYLFFDHTVRHAGSQFLDQGLNPRHGSESPES